MSRRTVFHYLWQNICWISKVCVLAFTRLFWNLVDSRRRSVKQRDAVHDNPTTWPLWNINWQFCKQWDEICHLMSETDVYGLSLLYLWSMYRYEWLVVNGKLLWVIKMRNCYQKYFERLLGLQLRNKLVTCMYNKINSLVKCEQQFMLSQYPNEPSQLLEKCFSIVGVISCTIPRQPIRRTWSVLLDRSVRALCFYSLFPILRQFKQDWWNTELKHGC